MTTQIWISTSNDPGKAELGPEWRYAGDLDEHRETDLWKVVQGCLGLRAASRRRSVDFYADLDPDSPGYQTLLAAEPNVTRRRPLGDSDIRFWLALHWAGPPVRMFFSAQHARFAFGQQRRPPEPHPGLLKKPAIVGMRLTANTSGFFDVS